MGTKIKDIYSPLTIYSPSSIDPLLEAYMEKCLDNGYAHPTKYCRSSLDSFIKGCIIDEIIESESNRSSGPSQFLDVLWPMAVDGDSDCATLNILDVDNYQLTKVNSPIFTANQGFTGDGASKYLRTGYNPILNGINYTLNSASAGVYQRTNPKEASYVFGGAFTTRIATLWNRDVLSNFSGINLVSGNTSGFPSIDLENIGLNSLNTEGGVQTIYADDEIHNQKNVASDGVYDEEIFLLCANSTGGATVFSSAQVSLFYVGGGISSKISQFYNRIQTYMTTIGAAV